MRFDDYIEAIPKMALSDAPMDKRPEFDADRNDAYSDVHFCAGIYVNYEFQREIVRRLGGKVLNAACADDPAGLGKMGAVNLDIQTFEKHSGNDFSKVPNFLHGSVMEIPFQDEHFDVVVLGEFLEHCKFDKAVQAVQSCRRVLKPGGKLVVTVPLDGRTPLEQRGQQEWPEEYDSGITCYHQTWWGVDDLRRLKRATKMIELLRAPLFYMLTSPIGGWGLVWEKPST